MGIAVPNLCKVMNLGHSLGSGISIQPFWEDPLLGPVKYYFLSLYVFFTQGLLSFPVVYFSKLLQLAVEIALCSFGKDCSRKKLILDLAPFNYLDFLGHTYTYLYLDRVRAPAV